MNKYVLLVILALFPSLIFGLDIYFLDDRAENNIIITQDKSIVYLRDIIENLQKRYALYNLRIETKEVNTRDKNQNPLIILEVDIITPRPNRDVFNGSHHSSPLIQEIILNLMQPGIPRKEYPIFALMLKLNGVFLDNVDNDMSYATIISYQTVFDWVYEYLFPYK